MQGIFRKENTDKALKYGIYRHLPTYEKIIRNLVSFLIKNNTIGKRIAEARINRNITQEHLEELSGLSVSTISRIETGKYMPTIENLLKLSEILDVGLDYFLYDLLPHNKDIQSPAIQDAISIMNQMGERQTEYIVKILKIYQASHQD